MNVSPPKYINSDQLHQELVAAGFSYSVRLRSVEVPQDQPVPPYAEIEEVIPDAELKTGEEAMLQSVVDAHVAMRDKTDAELAAEFQAEGTTPARKQEIRDMQSGLMPREQVPMT